ncbi:MAG: hypothetical protein RRB13_13460 [bacterium]|nr:hypothetical protein [bacterium]
MKPVVHCRCEIDLHQYETRMQILRRYNRADRDNSNWAELLERLRKMIELESQILADLATKLGHDTQQLAIYKKLRLEDLELYAMVSEALDQPEDQAIAVKLLAERKAEMSKQAVYDKETGLYNQQLGQRLLSEKIEEARRADSPFAVALLGPKEPSSIETIHLLGRRFAELIRWGDLAAHYGKESFLFGFPATDSQQAKRILSKLRSQTAGYAVNGGLTGVFSFANPDEEELALLDRLEEAFNRLRKHSKFFEVNRDLELEF